MAKDDSRSKAGRAAQDKRMAEIRERVESMSNYYYYGEQQAGIDNRTKMFLFERLVDEIHGENVLEFGFVDGLFTDMLLERNHVVTLVEGASSHIQYANEKYKSNKQVKIVESLFETYETDDIFDTIIVGDMIQFIVNPEDFLRKCKKILGRDGRLIVTTPNSRSLHRRIGAILDSRDPDAVSEHERKTGTVKMYDSYGLRAVLQRSGFQVLQLQGCFLKPLSSRQIADWDDKLLRAFNAIGQEFTDLAWFLYAVCKDRDGNG